MMMTDSPTSLRLTNNSADRSQTARPSRLVKGFFSRSRKRDDFPAAGRMTAKRGMGHLRSKPWQGGYALGAGPQHPRRLVARTTAIILRGGGRTPDVRCPGEAITQFRSLR